MTTLSEYLRAEEPDKSEPADFYVPGAHSWDDAGVWTTRARLTRQRADDAETIRPSPEWEMQEEGEQP